MISSTFWKKIYNWQQILWENMIDSTFWEKHDWQHILGKILVEANSGGKT
jgi:hypothetical protein